ncbi:MAG: hypothetical protein C0594_08690 [Marinilabiliales bacterium]|nr:MAG: hypothetical protein C0594_08690 [Marinilabiliales bacterium]
MNNYIKIVHIILLFFLLIAKTEAGEVFYSTEPIKAEIPDSTKIDELREILVYEETRPAAPGFFREILYWIGDIIRLIFSDKGAIPYIRYLIITAFLIFVIVKLFNIKVNSLMYSKKEINSINISELDASMKSTDLEEMLKKALGDKNYRIAIRLMYIKLLKQLSDHEIIRWEKQKTNFDYRYEIKEEQLRSEFDTLSNTYDYVWYGNFSVSESYFTHIKNDFFKLYKQIGKKEE